MMVSQQWPQDFYFLNESETKKDNSLINHQSKAYMWRKKKKKIQNQRCIFCYDHMQQFQAVCQPCVPAAAPSNRKKA